MVCQVGDVCLFRLLFNHTGGKLLSLTKSDNIAAVSLNRLVNIPATQPIMLWSSLISDHVALKEQIFHLKGLINICVYIPYSYHISKLKFLTFYFNSSIIIWILDFVIFNCIGSATMAACMYVSIFYWWILLLHKNKYQY